jgi:4-hydroxy-4-methyl-2-oxoglutarate aldolase
MPVEIASNRVETLASDELARWRPIASAIVADVSKGLCLIDPAIRALCPPGQQPRLFGRAVTAICAPPDFGAVLHAIDLIEPGDVLVIDAHGHKKHAMIGGILGAHLVRKKAAGIVCDGAVRDVAELAQFKEISVFTRHITPRGPTGVSEGLVNGSALIGGKPVNPGDLLIGDDDGVCVIAPEVARDLLAAAEAKAALEETWQATLRTGKSMAEAFGLEKPFKN